MRATITTTAVTSSLLGAAVAVTFLLPDTLSVPNTLAGAGPDEVRLTGVLRDFQAGHPDFGVLPAAGAGHYAGNVRTTLGSDRRPGFAPMSGSGGLESHVDLVAHWAFDEGAGGTATDSGGDNDGTLMSGPQWVAGHTGSALRFDGTNDHVEVPSSADIQISGNITFAGWFKLDADFDAASPDTMVIMEKFLDTEHDFHIAMAGLDYNRPQVPKGAMVFKVENGPDSDHYRYKWTNRTSWTAGVWYHFAATLDSSDTSLNSLIIDGVDDTSATDAGGIGFIDTDYAAPVRIGGKTIDYNGFATDIYFDGVIDDVMIFSTALVETDIDLTGGFKVTTQWEDDSARYIAPHLFTPASLEENAAHLVSAPTITNGPTVDSFDSTIGPYGGANIGPAPTWQTGATMPVVAVPTGLPFTANVVYDGNSTSTISADVHCTTFTVSNSHTLRVSGDVIIVADDLLSVENSATIELLAGATLTVYAQKNVVFQNSSSVNVNTADPKRFTLYKTGPETVQLGNTTDVYGTFFVVDGHMLVQNSGNFYGRYTGQTLDLENPAGFHLDRNAQGATVVCGNPLNDTTGAAGVVSDGGITSPATFAGWFRDIPGVNLSVPHTITLTRDGAGVYNYVDAAFYPVDDRLNGNEGESHNNYFTYALQASFEYKDCWQQFIEFQGGDGVWIFINGELVIDLGGVDAPDEQYIAVDRLGLTDGETYTLDIFYAQRQSTNSLFSLRTTLDFVQADFPMTISAAFD